MSRYLSLDNIHCFNISFNYLQVTILKRKAPLFAFPIYVFLVKFQMCLTTSLILHLHPVKISISITFSITFPV